MPTAIIKITENPIDKPGICNDVNVNTNNKTAAGREFSTAPMSFGITFTSNMQRTFLRFNLVAHVVSGDPPPKDATIVSAVIRRKIPYDNNHVFDVGIKSINPVYSGTVFRPYPSCPSLLNSMSEDPRFPRPPYFWGDDEGDVLAQIFMFLSPVLRNDWSELDVTSLVQNFIQSSSYDPANLDVDPATDDFLYNNICFRIDEGDPEQNGAANHLDVDGNCYQAIISSNASSGAYPPELVITYELPPPPEHVLSLQSTSEIGELGVSVTVDEVEHTTPVMLSEPEGMKTIGVESEVVR